MTTGQVQGESACAMPRLVSLGPLILIFRQSFSFGSPPGFENGLTTHTHISSENGHRKTNGKGGGGNNNSLKRGGRLSERGVYIRDWRDVRSRWMDFGQVFVYVCVYREVNSIGT